MTIVAPEHCTVAVIGAGFSGTVLALHLLRSAPATDRIVLIERANAPGRGVAFSSPNPHHLLNVPVCKMSVPGDQPLDFLDWLQREGPEPTASCDAASFVPRFLFGSYVRDRLAAAIRDAAAQIVQRGANVLSVSQCGGGFLLELSDGGRIQAGKVILATGNATPSSLRADPAFLASRVYRPDPWASDALVDLPPDAPVLIIGTGLTMVDTVISLLDGGHRGAIHALSRRGLLPHRHVTTPPIPVGDAAPLPGTLVALLRRVRVDVAAGEAAGLPWQAAVDQLRPHIQALWATAAAPDRARFLRHLRSWWGAHRHRIAPNVADRVDAARASGQLRIHAGRIVQLVLAGEGAEVSYRPRGSSGLVRLHAAAVINCTGPATDYARSPDPLFRSLLDSGLARPDALRLGLDVTPACEVVGRDSAVTPGLFAVGPLTRGMFWEIIAVPDIQPQCADVARSILRLD